MEKSCSIQSWFSESFRDFPGGALKRSQAGMECLPIIAASRGDGSGGGKEMGQKHGYFFGRPFLGFHRSFVICTFFGTLGAEKGYEFVESA